MKALFEGMQMSRWEHELGRLVAQRGRALVGYAAALCGDRREAEDLVQEALVRTFSRLQTPRSGPPGVHPLDPDDGPTNPEGYVRRAILHLYVDGTRRRSTFTAHRHLIAADDVTGGPASGVTLRADVAAALATLTPRERACTVLRYYEDLTVPQIAGTLGLADGTVKRHLYDAAAKLRGALGPPGRSAPAATHPHAEGGVSR